MSLTVTSIITSEPKVCSYIHVFEYFDAYFKYRKRKNPKFSFEMWTAELDVQSRSYLKMICSGARTVTPKFIEKFSLTVNLSARELEHLNLISLYHKCKSAVQRKIYLDKILESLETVENKKEIQNYHSFLSEVQIPLLQLILSFPNFEASETKLKQLLQCSKPQLDHYLKILSSLDLIESFQKETSAETFWKAKEKSFKVASKFNDSAILNYHQLTLQESSKVLNPQFQAELRHFRSVLFALSEDEFKQFVGEAESFLTKLKNQNQNKTPKDRRVFKVNLNAYAVTENID